MSFEIAYTAQAKQDLKDIYAYIAEELSEPAVAKKQLLRLLDAASSLDSLPMRYPVYAEEPWRSQGLRVMPKNKYMILYLPCIEDEIVYIVRVMYGGRDLQAQLRETDFTFDTTGTSSPG